MVYHWWNLHYILKTTHKTILSNQSTGFTAIKIWDFTSHIKNVMYNESTVNKKIC